MRTFATIDSAKLPGPCPGGVGLTTALVVLRSGWVVVGSLPTADGTAATAKAGCLLVLDDRGKVRETIAGHGVNGPWDMTALDHGSVAELFVTNVLNGTVADSVGNRITAIPNASRRATSAGTGRTVTAGRALNTPLGLALTRSGKILTVNAGDGNLVVTTPRGAQIRTVALDTSGNPPGAGALFGLAVDKRGGVYYVDDATNTLNLLH